MVTDLEPAQAALLERVMDGPRLSVADLTDAGVFPVPAEGRKPLPKLTKSVAGQQSLPLSA